MVVFGGRGFWYNWSMMTYPAINPVALQLGPVAVHWYGVLYLVGFFGAWVFANWRGPRFGFSREAVADLIFYGALGVIVGGRVGYMLIYDFAALVQNPLNLFKIYQGGMSFHGGLIGVILALLCFGRRYHKSFLTVMDFTAPLVPIGLACGRIGNFINGELMGRITDVPWAMQFPGQLLGRHPSQLYEFFAEGILLFIILVLYSKPQRPKGTVASLFLVFYGLFRFVLEFFREPDAQMGFYFTHYTMGQLLSLPMVIIGIILFIFCQKKGHYASVS